MLLADTVNGSNLERFRFLRRKWEPSLPGYIGL